MKNTGNYVDHKRLWRLQAIVLITIHVITTHDYTPRTAWLMFTINCHWLYFFVLHCGFPSSCWNMSNDAIGAIYSVLLHDGTSQRPPHVIKGVDAWASVLTTLEYSCPTSGAAVWAASLEWLRHHHFGDQTPCLLHLLLPLINLTEAFPLWSQTLTTVWSSHNLGVLTLIVSVCQCPRSSCSDCSCFFLSAFLGALSNLGLCLG